MIAERQHIEPEKKKTVAIDSRWLSFLYSLIRLNDGRYMLTITKTGFIVDFTVTNLGSVERIN